MINAITPFNFGENLVRVIKDENGEPWFVAKDVAEALGYPETTTTNIPRLCQHIPEEWKGRNRIPTLGGEQEMVCLSEQGLYFFLGRSDKPGALPFQKWLAGEVLPSIRKTGAYAIPGVKAVSQRSRESVTKAIRRLPSTPFGYKAQHSICGAEKLAEHLGITNPELVEELSLCFCKLFNTHEPLAAHPEKTFLTHESLNLIWDIVKRYDEYNLLPSRLAVFRQICAIADRMLEETLEERLERTVKSALQNYMAAVPPTDRPKRFEITVNQLNA